MPDRHTLLRRQIKRRFPDGRIPDVLRPLIDDIAEAYLQFDADRSMLERSLDLSSQELLQANAALRGLVSAFPDQLLRLDNAGTVLDVRGGGSSEAARGWAIGHPLLDQLPSPTRDVMATAFAEVAQDRRDVSREIELAKGGASRFFEARLLPIGSAEMLLILRDVTERHKAEEQLRVSQQALHEAHRELERRVEERTADLARVNAELRREMADRQAAEDERQLLEDQLRHAQKMEAIGRLAGGVAHDFNNLLTAVQGYSELLLARLHGSPLRDDVEEIYRAAERASTLTRQLLAFSRRQLLSPEVLDLNGRVLEMARMLRRLIGEHIAIDLRLAPDLWSAHADAAQLEQAIVNLALNARDAMPGGGTLIIETANHELAPGEAEALELPRGSYVALRVRDTGTGVARELRPRIFEPFFTTKPKGAGTGLGLAMVYGFVRQSGGGVTLDSEPGQGATFTVLLPRVDAVPRRRDVRPIEPAEHRGAGTILIAEDERAIRRLAASVLGQAGYRTLEAADGQQALELFASHGDEISLVVTDVIMPRMGGRELAERLLRERPSLPLIYVTGYAEEGDALRRSAPDASVLLKPFSPEALLRAVERVRV